MCLMFFVCRVVTFCDSGLWSLEEVGFAVCIVITVHSRFPFAFLGQ